MNIPAVPGKLVLKNGEVFHGEMPAWQTGEWTGEIVFTTGMVGYVESLTDPSFLGQILVFTYPLIGNYGVPDPSLFESEKIQVSGVIVSEISQEVSHFEAQRAFLQWLESERIPVLWGVDTRLLTERIRSKGNQRGVIQQDPLLQEKRLKIILVDLGAKRSLIRQLESFDWEVHVVPFDLDFTQESFDGVVLSSGPGDPSSYVQTVENVRKILPLQKPIFGICLGVQLLGLAIGAKTYPLPVGHRGMNHPCIEVSTGKPFLTTQNHGFAVDEETLPSDWTVMFRHMNDGTVAGIQHQSLPYFGVQFHPEGGPGPEDTAFLFERFYREVKGLNVFHHLPSGGGDQTLGEKAKVLLLGSGGFKVGQAGEFDYSGSQAIKALKEEGIHVVLINPNIATIQTDLADTLYPEPLNVQSVTAIIQKEKPHGILLGFGGQTALNLGLELEAKGILKTHRVQVLGTPIEGIRQTEDRESFKNLLTSMGIKIPKSRVARNETEALEAAESLGYPVMMRAGFSLGGLGSGKMTSPRQLQEKIRQIFQVTSQVLIEEFLEGWKEFEYEVVRDSDDNALAICAMENIDPMGIHTGDSLVVAPIQTLSNREYQQLRQLALQIARKVGLVGEGNIQFAVNPHNGDYRVIEMNARLSRSSALASKATGYPLAFIAAKLALGRTFASLKNPFNPKLTAFFEPALDYVVVKIPRWDTHKLKGSPRQIGTEMKSVGEVMAIGRSFKEAFQKAVRMLGKGELGEGALSLEELERELECPTDNRLFALYVFFLKGGSLETAEGLTRIDRWFLSQIREIAAFERRHSQDFDLSFLRQAKQYGFSDRHLARWMNRTPEEVRQIRKSRGIVPVVKKIDTLAGEWEMETHYLYFTYHSRSHEVAGLSKSIVVLGSGPYSIGSSGEFDWCAVNSARTLREAGKSVIIVNCNPETVSTDYDESDRLYCEELTLERIADIADFELPQGIVVSVGGQIPNNLALSLEGLGFPILGTSPCSIECAENREKFSRLVDEYHLPQPAWSEVRSAQTAREFVQKEGYPVLFRPSYVLSGASMQVVRNSTELEIFLRGRETSPHSSWVVSQWIESAQEWEMDGVARDGEIFIDALIEHIESAGVHSGDATLVFPAQTATDSIRQQAKMRAQTLVRALKIQGPFNIQFLEKNQTLYVIECNIRASRSLPFVSKVSGVSFIEVATRILLEPLFGPSCVREEMMSRRDFISSSLAEEGRVEGNVKRVAVKSPQFSYQRFPGADPVASVEMASTGEVVGVGNTLLEAFYRSWQATGQTIQHKRIVVRHDGSDEEFSQGLKVLQSKGYEIFFTGELDLPMGLVMVIPKVQGQLEDEERELCRCAINYSIPLITNREIAKLMMQVLSREEVVSKNR